MPLLYRLLEKNEEPEPLEKEEEPEPEKNLSAPQPCKKGYFSTFRLLSRGTEVEYIRNGGSNSTGLKPDASHYAVQLHSGSQCSTNDVNIYIFFVYEYMCKCENWKPHPFPPLPDIMVDVNDYLVHLKLCPFQKILVKICIFLLQYWQNFLNSCINT